MHGESVGLTTGHNEMLGSLAILVFAAVLVLLPMFVRHVIGCPSVHRRLARLPHVGEWVHPLIVAEEMWRVIMRRTLYRWVRPVMAIGTIFMATRVPFSIMERGDWWWGTVDLVTFLTMALFFAGGD